MGETAERTGRIEPLLEPGRSFGQPGAVADGLTPVQCPQRVLQIGRAAGGLADELLYHQEEHPQDHNCRGRNRDERCEIAAAKTRVEPAMSWRKKNTQHQRPGESG